MALFLFTRTASGLTWVDSPVKTRQNRALLVQVLAQMLVLVLVLSRVSIYRVLSDVNCC